MSSRHIAIIPARAGSKSIKDKNLIRLLPNNETITHVTCKQAVRSNIFRHVILSTNIPCQRIGLHELKGGGMTTFQDIKRPEFLCTDNTMMIDVVKHAMDYVGNDYDYVWLLQPTSPIRTKEDFEYIRRKIEQEKYNSVISFKEVAEHPNRCYTIKETNDVEQAHALRHVNFKNKQDLNPIFIRSGNFYVTHKDLIREHSTFENKPIFPFTVDRATGSNIDSQEDLAMLKLLISKGTVRID